jgi:hypothetical protein
MNNTEFFYDLEYSIKFKNLLTKSLKANSTITQLSNQDVIVRETLVRETIYAWNNELKKFVIKSKKII